MKTNVARLLAAAGIEHRQVDYPCADGAIDAISVADTIGVERERLFKTLVARGNRSGLLVFCIPGPLELDLKKAAAVSGNKKVALLAVRDLLPATGYERGACSPVGMTRVLPTWLDETARLFESIYISAGVHGAQICIAPDALARYVPAQYGDLI